MNLDKVRGKLMLHILSGEEGWVDVNINIDQIPDEWETFPNSEDEWINIPMPISENSSACLYKAVEKSLFKTHRHVDSREHMTIMNEGGSFTLYTEEGITDYKFPESCVIPKNIWHAVKFNTKTVIMCVWHPMFKKGWEASFKEEKNA